MTWTQFRTRIIEAAKRVGITDPVTLCMMLAMAAQESKVHDHPSSLALAHNNLFGVKWYPGDAGRYESVTLGANQFEGESQKYRVYPSLEASIWSWKRNVIENPDLYMKAKIAGARAWLAGVSDIWVDGEMGESEINPRHVKEVLDNFDALVVEFI